MRTVPFGLVLTLILGALFVGACGGLPTLQTQSLSRAPTVDGTLAEWDGTLTRVGNSPVSMSVVPTDSLLYVALLIPDQALIRSIAKRGLIVWVDPSGKKTHTYGVQYPIALQAQRAPQKKPSATERTGRSSALEQLLPSDLALIRNDTIRRRMPARLSSALRVRATLETGSLIYELAIPVPGAGTPSEEAQELGLPSALGSTIAIGVQTPESEDDPRLEQRGGIPSITGRGRRRPRRGRRRGGRRRRPPPPSPSDDDPTLDLWARFRTAGQ